MTAGCSSVVDCRIWALGLVRTRQDWSEEMQVHAGALISRPVRGLQHLIVPVEGISGWLLN